MSARAQLVLAAFCASCASAPEGPIEARPTAIASQASASPSASARAGPPNVRAQQLATQGPSCALLVDGGISCWAGELGPTPRRVPAVTDAIRVVTGRGEISIVRKSGELVIGAEGAAAFAGIMDAAAYAREYDDRCVVRKDGSVACAAMGADTLTKIQGISDARDVSVGRTHSCALVGARGAVACFRQGAEKPFATPVKDLEGAIEVAAGAVVGCARKADNSVHCFAMQTPGWGSQPAASATAMAVGDVHHGASSTYLCTASGKYGRCRWVDFIGGELTRGSELLSITAGRDIRQLSTGHGGVCAVDEAGEIVCTGNNDAGELAIPSPGFLDTPTKIDGFSPLSAIVLGDDFACGLTRDGGGVECTSRTSPPTPVAGFDAPVVTLIGLGAVVCGLDSAGAVSCFKPERDQKPARRFSVLDNARSFHSSDPHRAVAIVSKDGRLSLGAFAFDMSKLAVRAVPNTRDLTDATLEAAFDTVESVVFDIWMLDAAGKVEKGLVNGLGLPSREKVAALDGAAVLDEHGRVIKKSGELWAFERLLRTASPLTTLIGEAPCGRTQNGELLCLDAPSHLSAKLRVAGEAAPMGAAKGASSHRGMTCVLTADGAPRCSGKDNIGMLDKQRRTSLSSEAHRIPL